VGAFADLFNQLVADDRVKGKQLTAVTRILDRWHCCRIRRPIAQKWAAGEAPNAEAG
jgi:hypothetical protein